MAKKEDKIPGGLTDNWTVEQVAKKHDVSVEDIKKQLKKGEKVELEHTNSKDKAKEIALDHLYEDPKYYTNLKDMEDKAKKDMNEGKESITEFAKRMRELTGLSENEDKKRLKTIQEGENTFDGESKFMAKDFMKSNDNVEEEDKKVPGDLDINGNPIPAPINESEDKTDEEFETHKFEQKTIEEGENDDELYQLDENTIIVLDFLDGEEEEK